MWRIFFLPLFFLIFNLTACSSLNNSEFQASDIVILGKISIPNLQKTNRVYLEAGPSILMKGSTSIAYGVIDQEYIKFIGSRKTPYNFITGSFDKQPDSIEKIFLESFLEYKLEKISKNNLIFYKLIGDEDMHLYILSKEVNFIIDVYIKSKEINLIDELIEKSKLL